MTVVNDARHFTHLPRANKEKGVVLVVRQTPSWKTRRSWDQASQPALSSIDHN